MHTIRGSTGKCVHNWGYSDPWAAPLLVLIYIGVTETKNWGWACPFLCPLLVRRIVSFPDVYTWLCVWNTTHGTCLATTTLEQHSFLVTMATNSLYMCIMPTPCTLSLLRFPRSHTMNNQVHRALFGKEGEGKERERKKMTTTSTA